jgi:hypothetical protein
MESAMIRRSLSLFVASFALLAYMIETASAVSISHYFDIPDVGSVWVYAESEDPQKPERSQVSIDFTSEHYSIDYVSTSGYTEQSTGTKYVSLGIHATRPDDGVIDLARLYSNLDMNLPGYDVYTYSGVGYYTNETPVTIVTASTMVELSPMRIVGIQPNIDVFDVTVDTDLGLIVEHHMHFNLLAEVEYLGVGPIEWGFTGASVMVPEPTSLSLLGGVMASFLRRKR